MLRPYQQNCLDAIRKAVLTGRRHLLVHLPTGAGKTYTFAHLSEALGAARTMIVAHRSELLTQARKTLAKIGVDSELEQGTSTANPECATIVASVQTLKNGRLEKFAGKIDLLVIDEAHHGMAPTYLHLVRNFPNAIVVGFTATPFRSDEKELLDVFTGGIVFSMTIGDLTRKGYLVPIKTIDHKVSERYDPEEVFAAHQKYAKGLKTIVFCRNVQHSLFVAGSFLHHKVPAYALSGDTRKEDRTKALIRFAKGEIQVLTNCGILTEGFDEPTIECVVLARKTESRSLYEQMVGRGTRLSEGKDHVKVLQLIGVPPIPVLPLSQRPWVRWLKRLVWLLTLVGLALWFKNHCSMPPESESESQRFSHVFTACKLRTKPSKRAPVITILRYSDNLTKIEARQIGKICWTKVEVNGTSGWCGCRLTYDIPANNTIGELLSRAARRLRRHRRSVREIPCGQTLAGN